MEAIRDPGFKDNIAALNDTQIQELAVEAIAKLRAAGLYDYESTQGAIEPCPQIEPITALNNEINESKPIQPVSTQRMVRVPKRAIAKPIKTKPIQDKIVTTVKQVKQAATKGTKTTTEKLTRAERIYKERMVWLDKVDPEARQKALDKAKARIDEATVAYGTSEANYISKLMKHAILSREEEVELAKRIERGDLAAKEQLILQNMKLIANLALPFHRIYKIPHADMIQEGVLGATRAAEKFDYRQGNKFSTYATWWIKQACQRAVDDKNSTIRIPVHIADKLRQYNRAIRDLQRVNRIDFEPNNEMIAEYMGCEVDTVEELRRINAQRVTSLDKPANNEANSSTLGELLDNGDERIEDATVDRFHQQSILDLVHLLPDRAATVISMRYAVHGYNEEHTLQDIASKVGMTREKVGLEIKQGIEALGHLAQTYGIDAPDDF